MKRYAFAFLTAVSVMVLLHALNAECDAYTVAYSYYRAPDPNSHAWINVTTRMHGLSAYDSTVGTGPEGNFLPASPGNEPDTLQKGYDTIDQWVDYLNRPLQWRTLASERKFDSPSSVAFSTPDYCPPLEACSRIFYPYPAMNPLVNVSGQADAKYLRVGGQTTASAMLQRNPPAVRAAETISIKNQFTVLPGSTSKTTNDTAQLAISFRLEGTLNASYNAHSQVGGYITVTDGSQDAVSFSGNVNLLTGPIFTNNGSTSSSRSLSYSTNAGASHNESAGVSTSIFGFDTGLLTLNFNALVGTTYDVNLTLMLLSEANGDGNEGASLTKFWDGFSASIISTDGTFLSWLIAPPMNGDLDGNGVIDLADEILALQTIAGMKPAGILANYATSGVDVNRDGKIGVEEAIFIVQKLAGIR